jgi:hypothetical protein
LKPSFYVPGVVQAFDPHQSPPPPLQHSAARQNKELAMPVDSILVSAAVVTMFAVFAGVLLWGSFQTAPPARQEPATGNRKRRSF